MCWVQKYTFGKKHFSVCKRKAAKYKHMSLYILGRGKPVLEALLGNLLANGLKQATEVILTGCSGNIMSHVSAYTSVVLILLIW